MRMGCGSESALELELEVGSGMLRKGWVEEGEREVRGSGGPNLRVEVGG